MESSLENRTSKLLIVKNARTIRIVKLVPAIIFTAWKVSIFGVFQAHIFPRSDWIRRDTEYLFEFSPNAGKCGPGKLQIRTLFTECLFFRKRRHVKKHFVLQKITVFLQLTGKVTLDVLVFILCYVIISRYYFHSTPSLCLSLFRH